MIGFFEIIGVSTIILCFTYVLAQIYFYFFRKMDLTAYQTLSSSRSSATTKSGSTAGDGGAWAVITGASDGIGLGFAKTLLDAGFNIVLIGRNESKLQNVQKDLQQRKRLEKSTFRKDQLIEYIVSEASDIRASNIEKVVDQLGQKYITILVNNVGISISVLPLTKHGEEDLIRMVNVNCIYPTLLTRKLIPILQKNTNEKQKQRSLIINTSSVCAILPTPFLSTYAATKAYNNMFSQSLAKELACSNVDVISVMPGRVQSLMNPTKNTTFTFPSAVTCATGVLRQIGLPVDQIIPTFGHYLHASIGRLLSSVLPNHLFLWLFRNYAFANNKEIQVR